MNKIYDLNYELFNAFTEEEKQDFFNKIKSQYNETIIEWYLINLGIHNQWLQHTIMNR